MDPSEYEAQNSVIAENPDPLLSVLGRANYYPDLTMVIGGLVITGRLATLEEWLRCLGETSEPKGEPNIFQELADSLSEGPASQPVEVETHLHLVDAQWVGPTGHLFPAEPVPLRLRISEVSAWTFGRTKAGLS